MEHNDSDHLLSKEELHFNDFIRRGDDFMKINIYRNARECYNQALEIHFNDTLVNEKIYDCVKKIKSESKIIYTILIVAALITGTCLLMIHDF